MPRLKSGGYRACLALFGVYLGLIRVTPPLTNPQTSHDQMASYSGIMISSLGVVIVIRGGEI